MTPRIERVQFPLPDAIHSLILGDFVGFRQGIGGVEYGSIRPYFPGDQTKDINGPVSDKFGSLYVNVRYPERELEVLFVPDFSASMHFGSKTRTKFDALVAIVHDLIDLLSESRVLFSMGRSFPSGVRIDVLGNTALAAHREFDKHLYEMARTESVSFEIAQVLDVSREHSGARSIYALVLSDFIDIPPAYYTESLRRFCVEKHRIAGLALVDPLERVGTPRLCALRARDSETGGVGVVRSVEEHTTRHARTFSQFSCPFGVIEL